MHLWRKERHLKFFAMSVFNDATILDDKQHAEMSQIHSSLDETASSELESIFGESEHRGTQIGSTLRQIWEQDRCVRHDAAKQSFFTDQEKSSECHVPT